MVAVFSLFGLALGSRAIGDNSMFVHLRTGIDVAAGLGIPRVDPYSFTAHGQEWVVQSWLASLVYGWVERLGGLGWVAAFNGVLAAGVAFLTAQLARSRSTGRTIVAGGLAIGVAAPYWSARPLMFGLLGLALTVVVVERRAHPAWLVPVVWVWANSHGSFPLGLLWLGAVTVGAWADERRLPRDELRYVAGFVAGLLVSTVNPLGPKLLWFPLTVGDKRSVFENVVEWQSPNFQTKGGMLAVACLALALLALFRQRVPWRDAIPVVGFVGLGLLAMRNLAPMGIVLAPALRRALLPETAVASARRSTNTAIAGLLAVVFVVLTAGAARGEGIDASAYPESAVSWLERNGYTKSPHRIAQQDVVGCYYILRYGRSARVFIDDRVDMYPVDVSEDYRDLLQGHPRSLRILDRHRIDAVLWEDDKPLVAILQETGDWRRAYERDDWVVFVRRK